MFGKKILGLVSLLFLSNQLKHVKATANGCVFSGVSSSGCTIDSGCKEHEYNKYYVITGGSTRETSGSNIAGATLVRVSDDGNDCDAVSNDDIGIYESTSDSDTKTIITKSASGISIVTDLTISPDCVDGKLTNTGKLCIGATFDGAITLVDGKEYLVKNAYSVFTGTSTDFVKAKYQDNSLILAKPTSNDDFCVSTSSRILTERVKNYCDNENCDAYYNCASDTGVCLDKTNTDYLVRSNCNTITGEGGCQESDYGKYYYLGKDTGKDNTNLSDYLEDGIGKIGYLYECTISASPVSCVEKSYAGYFENAADGDIKYIQCSVTGAGTTECKGLGDIPDTVECTGTNNGISLDGSEYKTCTAGTPGEVQYTTADVIKSGADCTGIDNGGLVKISTDYKICIKQEGGSLAAVDFSNLAADAVHSYFVDSGNTNAFNDASVNGYFVAVKIDKKTAIVDQDATPKKYRYAKKDTREIIEKSGAEDAGMCTAGSLKTSVGHEFSMTSPTSGTDSVHYYKEIVPQ